MDGCVALSTFYTVASVSHSFRSESNRTEQNKIDFFLFSNK